MNRTYRLVWSERLGSWIVASECTRTRGKRGAVSPAILLSCMLGAMPAFGADPSTLPSGGQVVAGAGSINQNGTSMTITQSTDRLITNWQSFNIGSQASVQFIQPNAASVALNRVQSGDASYIFGNLTANGQVFLVNPNGVLFGPASRVDVGGLVASSLSLSDENFLAGNYRFTGTAAGSILNRGQISGKVVAFIGPRVGNEGVISAPGGSVAMAAGGQASLDFSGDGLVRVNVDQAAVNALAENHGLIRADGGTVTMSAKSAGDLMATVVNNEGVIEARGLIERNGRILLDGGESGITRTAGTLDVSHAQGTGGQIVVTGDKVLVDDGARLDARGSAGGGGVYVGGGWQGSDPAIRQANATIVASTAVLDASATDRGGGGTVVAWSDINNPDSLTRAHGTFLAQGGASGGDGGRIETSGYKLDTRGARGSAAASAGKAGEWLFDPYNITITANSSASYSSTAGAGSETIDATGNDSMVAAPDIVALLEGGTNVVITTGAAGAQAGNITVNAAVTKASGNTDVALTLRAANSIILNESITNTGGNGKLDVTLHADSDNSGFGGIMMNANTAIVTRGGSITLSGGADLATGFASGSTETDHRGVWMKSNTTLDASGTAAGGNIVIRGTGTTTGEGLLIGWEGGTASATIKTSHAGSISLTGQGGGQSGGRWVTGTSLWNTAIQTASGAINISGTGGVGNGTDDNSGVLLYETGAATDNRIVSNSGAINITGTRGTGTSTVGAGIYIRNGDHRIGQDGTLVTNSTSDITLQTDSLQIDSGALQSSGALQIKPLTASSTIGIGDSASGTLNLTASELNTLQNGFSSITIGHESGSGAIDVRAYTFKDPLTIRTPSGAGNITVNGALATGSGSEAGSITLQAGNNITLAASTSIITQGQALILNSDRDASGSGAIALNTGASIATNGGNVTMGGGADPATTAAWGVVGGGHPSDMSGVYIRNAALNSGGGDISIRGNGVSSGSVNEATGVMIENGSVINSGTGKIAITGVGPLGGGTGNIGVNIRHTDSFGSASVGGSTITSASTAADAIVITGTGSTSGAANSAGVVVQNGSSVNATGAGGGISITGTGGTGADSANHGIFLLADAAIGIGSGNLTMTGTGGSGAQGLNMAGTSTIGSGTSSGDFTLNANSMELAGGNITGTGALLIQPILASTAIGLGDGASGTLNLTSSEVGKLADGFSSITIGRSDGSGAIDVRNAAFKDTVTIRTPSGAGNITVNGALVTGSGSEAGDITLQAGNHVTVAGSGSITTQGRDVTLNSDRDASGAGAIAVNSGAAIATNGGNITLRGGSAALNALPDPTIVATQGDFIFNGGLQFTGARGDGAGTAGISIDGASLNAGGGNIHLRGIGDNGKQGVSIAGGGTVATTGTGTIDIFGAGGGSGNENDGVAIVGAGSAVTSASGNINVYGLGRGGSSSQGVVVEGSGGTASKIESAGGTIAVRGASSGTGSSNQGVLITNAGAMRTTGTGNIDIVGRGSGTGFDSHGIFLNTNGLVQTAGGGAIALTGYGSSSGTSNNNEGVKLMNGSVAEVQTGAGHLTVTGTGGTGNSYNIGVNALNSTFRMGATATGTMSITGTGGAASGTGNWGVLLENGGIYESLGAATIELTGTGGTGSDNAGLKLTGGATNRIGSSTMSGAITLTADSIDFDGVGGGSMSIQSSGALLLQPLTATATMGIGTGASGSFNLNATELGRLADGFSSIAIGRADSSGAVDIRAAAFKDPVTIRTPTGAGSITVNGALATGSASQTGSIGLTAGGSIALSATGSVVTQGATVSASAGNKLTMASGSSIATNGGHFSGTFNAMTVSDAISGSIATGAGNLTLSGTSPSHLRFVGSAFSTTSGNLSVAVGNGTASGSKIELHGGASFTTQSGNIGLTQTDSDGWIIVGADAGGATISATGIGNVTLNNSSASYLRNGASITATGGLVTLTGSVHAYADVGNFTISNATGTVVINGPVTQTAGGTLIAGALALNGAGAHNLSAGANTVGTLAATGTSSVNFKNSGSLTVGTVGAVEGVTASGDITLQATGAAADLTLAKPVATTSGTIVLAAGRNFINSNAANTGIVPGTGRYLVYSANPADSTEAMTGYNKHYNQAYSAGSTPAYAGSGNWFLYSVAPVLSVAPGAQSMTYGASVPSFTPSYTGFLDGDTAGTAGISGTAVFTVGGTISAAGHATAGSHDVSYASGLASSLGYQFQDNAGSTGELTVNAKMLTLAGFDAAGKVYDGNTAATINNAGSLVGVIGGDTVTVSNIGANFSDKNAGIGKTVTLAGIALAGADGANYSIASTATNTANITAKAITLSGFAADNKVYDGNITAGIANAGSLVGIVGGDTVSAGNTGATFSDKNVGAGKTVTLNGISLSGADSANYSTATTVTTTADISPKFLSLAGFTADNKIYDGTTAATISNAGTLVGVVAGDTVSVSNTGAAFGDKNVGVAKTVTLGGIALTGVDSGNYSIASTATNTADITAKAIILSGFAADNKVYDGNITAGIANAGSLVGVVAGDTVSVSNTGAAFADKNAGAAKTVTLAGIALAGAESGNYSIAATATTTADISQKSLSLAGFTADNKIYDGTTAATISNAGTLVGVVAGDTVSAGNTGATFSDKNVGAGKTVILNGVSLSGVDSANYSTAATATTTADITPKPLSIGLNGNVAKLQDGTTTAALSSANYVVSGFVGTESASVVQTAGNYDTPNPGVGKLVSVPLSFGAFQTAAGTLMTNYAFPASVSAAIGTILAEPAQENILGNLIGQGRITGTSDSSSGSASGAGISVGPGTSMQTVARLSEGLVADNTSARIDSPMTLTTRDGIRPVSLSDSAGVLTLDLGSAAGTSPSESVLPLFVAEKNNAMRALASFTVVDRGSSLSVAPGNSVTQAAPDISRAKGPVAAASLTLPDGKVQEVRVGWLPNGVLIVRLIDSEQSKPDERRLVLLALATAKASLGVLPNQIQSMVIAR